MSSDPKAPNPPPRRGPVVIALDEAPPASAFEARPASLPDFDAPPDAEPPPVGRAMARAIAITGGGGAGAGTWFLTSLTALVTFLLSLAALAFVEGLMAAHPVLGWIATALFAAFVLSAVILALREVLAYSRLASLDRLRSAAEGAFVADDLSAALRVTAALAALYRGRADMEWSARRHADRAEGVLDTETLLALAERDYLAPLDQAARREIEQAARTVAAVTAIVPLALADVAAALFANLRMVRRIAALYGGRAGLFGSLRILRSVMVHLVATGAVAAGDDLIHSVAGGGLLSKLSRRFGEGVINGALTARVGVAAMEVCRPLHFRALPRPKITNLLSRGLKGLFASDPEPDRKGAAPKGP